MTTTDKEKRLDQIEAHLTPREWAIRIADDLRNFPDHQGWMIATAKENDDENMIQMKAYKSLYRQAEERFPGDQPEAIRARIQLERKLRTEFRALLLTITSVNSRINEDAEKFRLRAALQFSIFLILRYDTNRIHFPSTFEEWADDTAALLLAAATQQAAVKTIQDKYFDGHSILCRDFEASLEEAIKLIEDVAAKFNEYLQPRTKLSKMNKSLDIDGIKDRAGRDQAPALATEWMKLPKAEAFCDEAEPHAAKRYALQFFREEVGNIKK